MSKELTPLEALQRIRRESGIPYFSSLYDFDMWEEDLETIEKALKALEIIKKYTTKDGIEINFLQFFGFDGSINEEVKKEFELLKEVLK